MSRPRIVDTDDELYRIEVRSEFEDRREILTVVVYRRQDRSDKCLAAFEIGPSDLRYLLTGKG